MAYNLLQLLVPARFLLTFGHLVPTLMMILTRKENIMAALPADPSDGQIKRAKDEVIPILRAPSPSFRDALRFSLRSLTPLSSYALLLTCWAFSWAPRFSFPR
mmetsp:Transcript_4981/g.15784  ORF Transcript_4981/g.15784 Transcript_4981/m.15784 type:complete len:103 (+) Transcript_4981:216-524(+)